MNRRTLLSRCLTIAAAVGLAPAAKAEAAPSTGYGLHATWYLEQNRDGAWLIIDQASGDVYTSAPSDEMLDAITAAMEPAPLTFKAMAADCRARGCDFAILYADSFGYGYRHRDRQGRDQVRWYASLARVDAWRTSLHEGG